MSANTPPLFSKNASDDFPPAEYPLKLDLSFDRRRTELKKDIKQSLDKLPKTSAKYRSKDYITTSFDCYFKDVDAMRPLLNGILKDEKMVIMYVLKEEERVFPSDLLKMANEVLYPQEIKR